MNLTQWRKERKERKNAIIALLFPIFTPSFPPSTPVIPAKAGIQMIAVRLVTRKQVRIAVSGSPLPLWACRGRFPVRIRIFRIRQARVFDGQALIRIRLDRISSYGEKRKLGEVKS